MAVSIKKQILGLQVSVDDVQRMQIIQRERNLGGVEFGDGVGEPLEDVQISMKRKRRESDGTNTCDFRNKLKSSPPSIKSMTM